MAEDTIKREEYAPITQGLRGRLKVAALGLATPMIDGLMAECDNIDALHEALEDENAELRKELKERPIAGDAEVMAFVDRLSDAAEKREDVTLWGVDYMPYPVDADGVAIHIGDVMDTNAFGTVEVEGFIHSAIAFYNYNEDQQARLCTSPAKLCHHHKPTVADVLREFYVLAVRGKEAHAEDVDEDVLAEYAAKLRLAGDAE